MKKFISDFFGITFIVALIAVTTFVACTEPKKQLEAPAQDTCNTAKLDCLVVPTTVLDSSEICDTITAVTDTSTQ